QPLLGIGAAGYMLFDVGMLGVCFNAFGNATPPVGVLLLAYLIGQIGGLLPIPGGIGGVDGGLIGTLVLFDVPATNAAVAVLAYRGILLAVPAILGLPALAVLRRRLQTESHDIAACAPGQEVEVLGRGMVAPYRTREPV
ncbi:MAG: putative heme transporter, partial [Thermoleophilaceae bacterium]|nr:putative heme transporter [Thermoleophilaceae bacterium]